MLLPLARKISSKQMKKTACFMVLLLLHFYSRAQLADDFTDGDFTSNPTWSGDAGLWQVVGGQLNSNSSTPSSSFYLSTVAVTGSNTEWRIYVNLKFATSGANYTDIFLALDSANLLAVANGYFVRIGGTPDEISLYREDAGVAVKIIDGTDGRAQVNSSDNKIHLKVTRSAADTWTLSDDNTGTGLSFFTEGTVTDATWATGAYFGIAVTQSTASFFNKHFYDDISVGPIQVDTVPPAVSAINVVSSTQIDVLFNEPLDTNTANNELNYSADNGLGNPSLAAPDASNPALVHVTFLTPFTNGLLNTLTVTAVADPAGNAIVSSSGNFTYIAGVIPAFRDVIINEIFADPTPSAGLPGFEFLELYNRSSKTFDLGGWILSDGTSNAVLPPYAFGPGQYLIVCAEADTILFSPFGPAAGASAFPSLNNSGDNLTLTDNTLVPVDAVAYTDNWYHDDVKKDGGWTLELINPEAPSACGDSVNWKASNDPQGGTPGQQNSVYSTAPDAVHPELISLLAVDSVHLAICFSEIIPDFLSTNVTSYSISGGIGQPVTATPLPGGCVDLLLTTGLSTGITYTLTISNLADCAGNPVDSTQYNFNYYEAVPALPGDIILNEILFNPKAYGYDYVEVYNNSQKAIDLATLNISSSDVLTGELIASSPMATSRTLLLPGEYAVVTENPGNIKLWYEVLTPDKLYEVDDLPTFDDEEGVVVITDQALTRLDEFHYYESYQFPLIKDVEGVALERLSASRPTQDAGNWHSAAQTAKFGTPTYKNSESLETGGTESNIEITPQLFSPDADGNNDVVNILYHFDTPGYVANISIYDTRGREVRKLVRNVLLGNDGTFTWDGINEDHGKAAIGIYVIFIEIFNQSGDVNKYKKTCVLGSKL